MCRSALFVCLLGAFGFAPAPFPRPERTKPDANAADLALLQGEWRLTATRRGGWHLVAEDNSRIVVSGAKLTYLRGNLSPAEYTITLDARSQPKTFTLTSRDGLRDIRRGDYSLDASLRLNFLRPRSPEMKGRRLLDDFDSTTEFFARGQ